MIKQCCSASQNHRQPSPLSTGIFANAFLPGCRGPDHCSPWLPRRTPVEHKLAGVRSQHRHAMLSLRHKETYTDTDDLTLSASAEGGLGHRSWSKSRVPHPYKQDNSYKRAPPLTFVFSSICSPSPFSARGCTRTTLLRVDARIGERVLPAKLELSVDIANAMLGLCVVVKVYMYMLIG